MNDVDTNRSFRDQAINTLPAHSLALSKRGNSRERNRREQATMLRLRDSLIYRAEAVDWHSMLVAHLVKSALTRLESSFPNPNAREDILRMTTREQQFAFDDVIFNIIALFDYVGNTIGFAFYGDHRRKAKWDRIERYARSEEFERRDNTHARVSTSEVGELVRRVHQEFVKPLSDYRAELIHYETDPAKGSVRTRFGPNEQGAFDIDFDISVKVPDRFSRYLSIPGYEATPCSLTVAAKWLANESQRWASAVLLKLERELKREAGVDPNSSKRSIIVF